MNQPTSRTSESVDNGFFVDSAKDYAQAPDQYPTEAFSFHGEAWKRIVLGEVYIEMTDEAYEGLASPPTIDSDEDSYYESGNSDPLIRVRNRHQADIWSLTLQKDGKVVEDFPDNFTLKDAKDAFRKPPTLGDQRNIDSN